MNVFPRSADRTFPEEQLHADLLVAGGGLAGLCAALAAARDGLQVILVQDRPVLGGNASSEVRLWANGATSHMGNNNRWAREGGIMGEILEENLWRNKEGNPVMFDLVLLDLARSQPGLTLLLNTALFDVVNNGQRITRVRGFNAINETFYTITAAQFCDATGDGVLGYLAGAEFRVGAEEADELGEKMAPGDSFGHKLGHSIYFYTKQTSGPVRFVPPSFALKEITDIPRYQRLTSTLNGCDLWWLEWGGRLDTVHQSEEIKWELWKIVWGVWDHIKNSGQFPDAENLTIEWVGTIPGKRESRRFMGDHLLCQQDIIEQRDHYDAVAYGGWSIDLHPADGVYSTHDGCRQFHSKGTYTIPWRSLYSRSLDNLFLTGRLISASHVAFGSARVMCTCGLLGEVVGRAAALCHQQGITPRQLPRASASLRCNSTCRRPAVIFPASGWTTRRAARGFASAVNISSLNSRRTANGQRFRRARRCCCPCVPDSRCRPCTLRCGQKLHSACAFSCSPAINRATIRRSAGWTSASWRFTMPHPTGWRCAIPPSRTVTCLLFSSDAMPLKWRSARSTCLAS